MVHLTYNSTHPFSQVTLSDRASVQELLRTVLDPLEPFFSPRHARVRVPGNTAVRFDQAASDLEGFARPLWGLAFLLAGKGEYRGTQWWIDGFKNGTNPESEEYWGFPRDNDQRMVEMCPLGKFQPYCNKRHRLTVLGFALAEAPQIWNGLSDQERENVENWLGNSINEKKYVPESLSRVNSKY